MINTKNIVSFEVAKLLKQKGFNELVTHYYLGIKEPQIIANTPVINTNFNETIVICLEYFYENFNDGRYMSLNGTSCMNCSDHVAFFEAFSAPTIQQVLDWLYKNQDVFFKVSIERKGMFSGTTFEKETIFINDKETSFQWCAKRTFFNYESLDKMYNNFFEYVLTELI